MRVEEILQGFQEEVGLGLSLEESATALLARGIDQQTHLTYRLRVLPKVTQLVKGRPGI